MSKRQTMAVFLSITDKSTKSVFIDSTGSNDGL